MASKKTQLSKAAQERMKTYEARSNVQESFKGLKKRDNRIAILAAVGALAIALGSQLGYAALNPATPVASPSADPAVPVAKVPDKSVAEDRTWTGSMELNDGTVSFELDGRKAPQAVANFVTLAKRAYFKGVNCHRVTTEAMYVLQCGDPSGNGSGGPGYNFGPIENAPADNIYSEGLIAMARRGGDGNSQGSQFFIVYKDTQLGSDAAGGYTVFGKVTSGLEVVKSIAAKGTDDGSGDGKPKNDVTIGAVKVK